jgi:tetratricopeptide (TPR) repeat protein
VYEKLGNQEDTEKLYHEILELDPNHFYTLNNLGAMEEARGRYELARAYLDKSITENPGFYLSRFNMGVVLKALGELDKAVEEYISAKDLKADFGNAYLNISAIRIEQDRLDEAVEVLSEGIRNSPSAHDLYYNRACCLSKLGREEEAILDLESALKLNPYLAVWVRRDNDFETLRENPFFKDLLDKAMEAIQKGR